MYLTIKSIIESGNFELSDMLNKIEVMWLKGSITDDERDELIQLARDNADVSQSVDVMTKLTDHDKRIADLEAKVEQLLAGATPEPEPTPDEYPAYVEGKWYYNGDKITFTDGKKYVCIAPEGQVCVWSPEGYPTYWQLVTE